MDRDAAVERGRDGGGAWGCRSGLSGAGTLATRRTGRRVSYWGGGAITLVAVSSGDLIADVFNLANAEDANYAIGYSGDETLTGGLRQDVMTGVQIDLSDCTAAPSSYTRSGLDVPPEPYG